MLSSRRHFQCSTGKGKVKSTRNVVESTKSSEMLSSRREMLSRWRHFKFPQEKEKSCRPEKISGNVVEPTRNVVEWATREMVLNRREMLSSLQHSNSHANKWKKRAPVWQHQPDVQIETVVCSFDTRSTSTWKFEEKECWLGAISESSPCEKGWISVLLQFFNLGLRVLLLSAQRIENTYSSLPAGGSCNLAFGSDSEAVPVEKAWPQAGWGDGFSTCFKVGDPPRFGYQSRDGHNRSYTYSVVCKLPHPGGFWVGLPTTYPGPPFKHLGWLQAKASAWAGASAWGFGPGLDTCLCWSDQLATYQKIRKAKWAKSIATLPFLDPAIMLAKKSVSAGVPGSWPQPTSLPMVRSPFARRTFQSLASAVHEERFWSKFTLNSTKVHLAQATTHHGGFYKHLQRSG